MSFCIKCIKTHSRGVLVKLLLTNQKRQHSTKSIYKAYKEIMSHEGKLNSALCLIFQDRVCTSDNLPLYGEYKGCR